MALAPRDSLALGMATGGIAFTVFNLSLPPLTDVRSAEPEDHDIFAAERTATWVAAGIVTGVALMAGDATVFIIGGTVVIAMAWLYRHANEVSPLSGNATNDMRLVPGMVGEVQDEGMLDVGPMAEAG
jgi:hypothetical protein